MIRKYSILETKEDVNLTKQEMPRMKRFSQHFNIGNQQNQISARSKINVPVAPQLSMHKSSIRRYSKYAQYANHAYCSKELVNFSSLVSGQIEMSSTEVLMYFKAPEIIGSKEWTINRQNTLEIYPAVIFTGHRLGGAIFAALEIQRGYLSRIIAVYTFGSPRFGNREFSQYVQTLKHLNVYRFTLLDDQVPRFPRLKHSYQQVETEYWIKSNCDCPLKQFPYEIYECKGHLNEESPYCLNSQIDHIDPNFTHDGPYINVIFKDCTEHKLPEVELNQCEIRHINPKMDCL
ncbi:hypothetical protein G9A89_016483 [Geosiphon pyriformis]|nr:hypothetical protein G9A89_016483 [Geosiphon pyriformis]